MYEVQGCFFLMAPSLLPPFIFTKETGTCPVQHLTAQTLLLPLVDRLGWVASLALAEATRNKFWRLGGFPLTPPPASAQHAISIFWIGMESSSKPPIAEWTLASQQSGIVGFS
ncbi:Hypothetical predicted protein [Podarcis lilfordi]|uniref:Uncharacterized protein n=1 Tax=Podarcis lilfordi TaxID=74358 RepID=A0AA35LGK4_9SAUR|nr:Hypothetical predicted protein [Podarcis lilfordi]